MVRTMSEKRKEVWIKIFTPENESKIASPAYMRTLLKVPDLSNIQMRLVNMERKIDELESPMRQGKIIETLRGQGPHNRSWLSYRVDYRFYDLDSLIEKGIIIESRSGTQRMIEVAHEREDLDPCSECGSPATHPSGVCRACYQAIKELS